LLCPVAAADSAHVLENKVSSCFDETVDFEAAELADFGEVSARPFGLVVAETHDLLDLDEAADSLLEFDLADLDEADELVLSGKVIGFVKTSAEGWRSVSFTTPAPD